MIEIKNLSKKYLDKIALQLDELQIPRGETLGVIGNNGAGKTTLFSCLLDLIKPDTGTIVNQGVSVAESEDWKQFTFSFLDETFLIEYLKAEEYFYLIGELRGLNKATVDEQLKPFEKIFNEEVLGQKKYLRDYSKGNQKKVGIAAAFLGNPQVIILDEPFANLDPSTQIMLKQFLKQKTQDEGITALISSHDLKHVTEVCNRIIILDKGLLVKDLMVNENSLTELEQYFEEQTVNS